MIWKPLDVYKIAEDVFGPERVCLDIMNSNWVEDHKERTSYFIVIHFPEINLTNSKGQKHTIRDIFVRFSIGNIRDNETDSGEFLASINMQGRRSTFTLKEAESGYSHSHLSTFNNWGSFCLGASSFAILLDQVKLSLAEEDWFLLFFSVEKYLQWESLEGGPYSRIANITYQQNVPIVNYEQLLRAFVKDIPLEVFEFAGELKLVKNHGALGNFYNQKSPIKSLNPLSQESANRKVRELNSQRIEFTFQDKTIKFKVLDPDDLNTHESTFIEKAIVDGYNYVIENKLRNFNKDLSYEQLKSSNKDRVLRAPIAYK